MTCRTWENLLQQHLDGVQGPESLHGHLQSCPDCATERLVILRFLSAMDQHHPSVPPADLADRITSALLAETPAGATGRWRPIGALAAAAALLLGVMLWARWPSHSVPAPVDPGPRVVIQPTPTEPLRESMAEARTAVASLTSRAANETIDQTTALLPLVQQTTLDPMSPMTTPIEPPLEPFREVTQGVSAGLAPVTDSARRAVGLFLRDLPMSRSDPDKKPG